MIVRHRDHEGLNERLLALVDGVGDDRLGGVLRRGTNFGQGRGNLDGCPVLRTVNEFADAILQGVVSGRKWLADQDFGIGRKGRASLHCALHGIDHVAPMQHRLSGIQGAGIEVRLNIALVYAGYLMRQRGNRAFAVVDTGQTQDRIGHLRFGADQILDLLLRLGVFPLRIERCFLADPFARILRLVHQHGAGIDEPLDVETFQRIQQMARSLDVDLIVKRAGLSGEIKKGDQVDDGSNIASMLVADLVQSDLH